MSNHLFKIFKKRAWLKIIIKKNMFYFFNQYINYLYLIDETIFIFFFYLKENYLTLNQKVLRM